MASCRAPTPRASRGSLSNSRRKNSLSTPNSHARLSRSTLSSIGHSMEQYSAKATTVSIFLSRPPTTTTTAAANPLRPPVGRLSQAPKSWMKSTSWHVCHCATRAARRFKTRPQVVELACLLSSCSCGPNTKCGGLNLAARENFCASLLLQTSGMLATQRSRPGKLWSSGGGGAKDDEH